jgi:HNH endonuclease
MIKECSNCKRKFRNSTSTNYCSVLCQIFYHSKKNENGCIEWQRYKIPTGYGRLGVRGRKSVLVHRQVYEDIHNVKLDSKELVCHKCDNPSCVNTEHLFVGDHRDNLVDSIKKHRRKYPQGTQVHNAKLNWELVNIMREKRKSGWTTAKIAKEMNLNHGTVRGVCNYQSWKSEVLA